MSSVAVLRAFAASFSFASVERASSSVQMSKASGECGSAGCWWTERR